jgi:hypothetical protein
VNNDEGESDVLIMSDEVHFPLAGYVNTENLRHWSDNSPGWTHEKPDRSEVVTIWYDRVLFYGSTTRSLPSIPTVS